jgi:hypothetical protein
MWDLWWTKGRWAGFLRVLRFPLPIFIPPVSLQSPSPIIRGWYSRPVVAAVPKVAPHKLKKKKKKKTWLVGSGTAKSNLDRVKIMRGSSPRMKFCSCHFCDCLCTNSAPVSRILNHLLGQMLLSHSPLSRPHSPCGSQHPWMQQGA